MPLPPALSKDILTAALAGLEAQKKTIEHHILQVQTLLGTAPKRRGRPPKRAQTFGGGGEVPTPFKKRRGMSAATRKRMTEVMKRRWAAARKAGRTTLS
jgi:hypothetical protein